MATNHTATSDYVMIQTNIIGIKVFFLYFTYFPTKRDIKSEFNSCVKIKALENTYAPLNLPGFFITEREDFSWTNHQNLVIVRRQTKTNDTKFVSD